MGRHILKVMFYVSGRRGEAANWVYLTWFDDYESAEKYLLGHAGYQQYKIDKVWSWPF
jgi:hypothetical protein